MCVHTIALIALIALITGVVSGLGCSFNPSTPKPDGAIEPVCIIGDYDLCTLTVQPSYDAQTDFTLQTDSSSDCASFNYQGRQVCLLYVESFSVSSGITFTAVGGRPLLVVSRGAVVIDGTVSVSSLLGEPLGAGADDGDCVAPTPAAEDDSGGAAGAAGGSFQGTGGNGGVGDTNMNRGGDGAAEPSLATAAVSLTAQIRGGCPGAKGGDSANNNNFKGGRGGSSGGGVSIASLGMIQINGYLLANGSGGEGGGIHAGGGGGGSGGLIRLDASMIVNSGFVVANGGGGGGGGTILGQRTGFPGTNGKADGLVAPGGRGSGSGGLGGHSSGFVAGAFEMGGTNGLNSIAAGGGGGGGTGFIDIRGALSGAGIFSPPPSN